MEIEMETEWIKVKVLWKLLLFTWKLCSCIKIDLFYACIWFMKTHRNIIMQIKVLPGKHIYTISYTRFNFFQQNHQWELEMMREKKRGCKLWNNFDSCTVDPNVIRQYSNEKWWCSSVVVRYLVLSNSNDANDI